tara:strand:+ start:162 stop:803 length:642 start_codon:yes stop_codon:yes gene_type:complete
MITTGYVYIIQSSVDISFSYIGSTFKSLNSRFKQHRRHYKRWLNNPSKYPKISIYEYFTRYGIETFDIKLIKSYDVYRAHNTDSKHLHVYELLWICNTKNSINQKMPFSPLCRSKIYCREVYERNKEQKLAYQTKYNETHKEHKSALNKTYYKKNKEQISAYRHTHKQQRKTREQIKISCPNCGKIVQKGSLNQHKKSMKCLLKHNSVPICCL